MTKLSIFWIKPIMVSSLLLAIASCTSLNANVISDRVTTQNHTKLINGLPNSCGKYYQQVISMPNNDVVSMRPVTIDAEQAAEIEELRKIIDSQVMTKRIEDLPVSDSSLTRMEAKYVLKYLYAHYYLGEYVPKNDYYAKKYLSKIFDFFEEGMSEQSIIGLMYAVADDVEVVSENNPTWNHIDDNEMALLFKLFIEAGSIDTEAMLLKDGLGSSSDECKAMIRDRLKVLAKQGSAIAAEEIRLQDLRKSAVSLVLVE